MDAGNKAWASYLYTEQLEGAVPAPGPPVGLADLCCICMAPQLPLPSVLSSYPHRCSSQEYPQCTYISACESAFQRTWSTTDTLGDLVPMQTNQMVLNSFRKTVLIWRKLVSHGKPREVHPSSVLGERALLRPHQLCSTWKDASLLGTEGCWDLVPLNEPTSCN